MPNYSVTLKLELQLLKVVVSTISFFFSFFYLDCGYNQSFVY